MAVSLRAAIGRGRGLASALGGIADQLRRFAARNLEGEESRLILWWPVVLGVGIAIYFALEREPSPEFGAALLVASVGLAIAARRARDALRIAALALLAMAVGFAAGIFRAAIVQAPVIERQVGPAVVEGLVESVDARGERRVAIRLLPQTVGRIEPEQMPRRVRITAARSAAVEVVAGARVRLRAVLMPPPEPVAPGAFDFARNAWFSGLGGVGYAFSRIEVVSTNPSAASDGPSAKLERLRNLIASRILEVAPGPSGAVAAALLTGKRGAIPDDVLNAMRDAGLAHLLAISGLHMALVCGTVFFFLRLCLALVPWLALRIAAKKWAAAGALVAGVAYYLLAGESVATERAFIMAAISLIAVLFDRPVITMRNVAIAATITLLLRPESLFQPGFQMSFGAVTALVAFYDAVRGTIRRRGDGGRRGLLRAAVVSALAVAATTVVATLATGPFAAYHFNRAAVYGLAANLAAVPLVGTIVMPLGLLGLAAMPFGLDAAPLGLMAMATGYIIEVAGQVAGWPGAVRLVPVLPSAFVGLFAIGGLWVCLWRRRWRWLGLFPVAAALVVAMAARGPDLIVARDGENIALRTDDGVLAVALRGTAEYSVETWLRRDGDRRTPDEAVGAAFVCDLEACAARGPGGEAVAYVLERSALAEECWRANILIARVPVTIRCPKPRLVIDLFDLIRNGSHEVRLGRDGVLEIATSRQQRGERPWVASARRSAWQYE